LLGLYDSAGGGAVGIVRALLQALGPGQETVFGRSHILPFETYTSENV
jgi:hypothetical protein